MARQAQRKDDLAAAPGISDKKLRRIWSEVSPQGFVERLKRTQPNARWSASGSRISGCCPYHDDRTPSFHIYLDRGYAKCFGCGQFVWNPVSLWAHIHNYDTLEAIADLKQSFRLTFLTAAVAGQFRAWERHQAMKGRIVSIAHETMLDVINNPDASPVALREGVSWLVEDRKIPMAALPTFDMVGVLPPLGHILDRLDAEAAEENARRRTTIDGRGSDYFVSYANEAKAYLAQANLWVGCVVFRYDIGPSSAGRIKLRRPRSQEFIFLEDKYVEEIGFFGLGWNRYKHLLGPQQTHVPGIHLVEGEFDTLTLLGHQIEEFGGPQLIAVGAGGRATAAYVDGLYSASGMEEVYLVGDSPDKNGDVLVEAWLTHLKKLRAKVFTGWAKMPAAGDPDEAVLQYGIRTVIDHMLDTRGRGAYMSAPDWVFEKAAPELAALTDGDVRQRVEVASGWGRLLKDPVECDLFVEGCAKTYNIPSAALKRQIVAQEEDQPGFVQRLADVFTREFFVIGQEVYDGGRTLLLWHRARKTVIRIQIGDEKSIERELAAVFGPLFQFFTDHVGVPAFMQASSKEGPYLQKFDAECRFFAKQAFMLLAQNAMELGGSRKAQGIHVIRGDEPEIYVVNGKSVYHGAFQGTALKWTELEGPTHNGNVFDIGLKTPEKAWMRTVHGVADLDRAPSIDLRSVFDRLSLMLDLGWRFKHHQSTVKFLAAHLIAASVGAAFKRQPMVGVHAESQSGKSRLLMGLISGKGFPGIHVLSAAVGMDTYTAAGVRQYMADKARPLALDEFENEGANDKKTRTVKDVLELFRNLTGEDNSVNYGSRTGAAVVQSVSMFVFVAAITKPEKVQDANRMVPVEMVKGDIDDPEQTLKNELGVEYISSLRNDLEVVLLPYVKQIQYEYAEIAKYYSRGENRPKNIESRYMEGLQPALTVLKLVGEDHRAFLDEYCSLRQYDIVRTVDQSEAAQLFNWVLESPQLRVRMDANSDIQPVSLLSLLATPSQRRTINGLSAGVFFDEVDNLLVVNWTQAVQTVLRQHPRYGKDGHTHNIRELANRHPTALKPTEIQASGVLKRLSRYGVGALGLGTISAFRIGKVIQSFGVEEVTPAVTATQPTSVNKDETHEAHDYFRTGM